MSACWLAAGVHDPATAREWRAPGELLAEVIDSQTMESVSITSATGCLNALEGLRHFFLKREQDAFGLLSRELVGADLEAQS